MKKLFLLLSICTTAFGLMAKEVPYVIIHKSNGGYQAFLNLYNEIIYTPSAEENVPANLECFGKGWSFCRVPRNSFGTSAAISSIPNANDPAVQSGIISAVNQIIEYSENVAQKGTISGSKSVTFSPITSCKATAAYFVKGVWSYNKFGEGTLSVYVNYGNISNATKAVR